MECVFTNGPVERPVKLFELNEAATAVKLYESTLVNLGVSSDKKVVLSFIPIPVNPPPEPGTTYRIQGITRLDGQIAQATMRLYEAVTGELRAETQSDSGTGEYSFEYTSEASPTGDLYWSNVTLLLPFDTTVHSADPNGGMDGTIVGSAALNTAFAKHGDKCLAIFNNGYVSYGVDPTGKLDFAGDAFTVDAWAYLLSYPTSGQWRTIVQNLSDSPSVGWRLLVGSAGQITFAGYPDTGAVGGFTSSNAAMPLNQWAFIRVTYDPANSNALKCYVNGVSVFSSSAIIRFKNAGANAKVLVGVTTDLSSWKWNGYLDSIRVTKGTARTPSEVPVGYYETGAYAEVDVGVMRQDEKYFVSCHYPGDPAPRPLMHGPIEPDVVE
jgi:hypothetical protein